MSDRDVVLLAAGGAMGFMSAFHTLFVLGLLEEMLTSRGGEGPRDEEIAFWQPSRSMLRRWDLCGVVALVVFLLTSFQGLVAVRESPGW